MRKQVFNPSDFLEVAEHLMERVGEASDRSAISRAYYCVFLTARKLAGIDGKRPSAHVDTWRHFEELGDCEIADGLKDLRRTRNVADYETDRHVSHCQCLRAIQKCRQTSEALKRFAGRIKYNALPAVATDPH